MTQEIWKDIEGYNGKYQVSNLGRVMHKTKGIMKTSSNSKGYHVIGLAKNGVKRHFFVHRLVAQTFIPNQNKHPQVNHIDEDKTNNRVDNLEWCTAKHNCNYGTRTKRIYDHGGGSRHKRVGKFDHNGNLLGTWESIRKTAIANGVSPAAVSLCANGKPSAGSVFGYVYRFVQ